MWMRGQRKCPVTTNAVITIQHKFHISIKYPWPVIGKICSWANLKTRPRREKAEHWAPRSEFHCQDHLEKKACAQLLPQPQEGLTSHCLTHCPASDTALCVTASLHCGGKGDWWRFLVGLDDRKQTGSLSLLKSTFHIVIIILFYNDPLVCLSYWPSVFSVSSIFLSPLYTQRREGGQGQSTYGGPGQDKHTWSVLNWVLPKPQNTLTHSILMHPCLPQ